MSAPAGIGSSVTIFRVTVTGTNQIPTQLSARIGSTYDDQATLREATQVSAGTFEVEFPTASIVAGVHVWVRATYPDGSVCETGADDFGL